MTFAIDIFRRQRTVPPIFVYFQAATFYTKNPGDFSSDAEWRTYMNQKQEKITRLLQTDFIPLPQSYGISRKYSLQKIKRQ